MGIFDFTDKKVITKPRFDFGDSDIFDEAFEFTALRNEGGDHVDDSLSNQNIISKFGVTQQSLDSFNSRNNLPKQNIIDLEETGARDLLDKDFFTGPRINELPGNDLIKAVFDFSVHSGPAAAIKTLQNIVGTVVDGIIGKNTIQKTQDFIDQNGEKELLQNLVDDRHDFLKTRKNYLLQKRGLDNRIQKNKDEFNLSLLNPFHVKESAADEIPKTRFDFGEPEIDPNIPDLQPSARPQFAEDSGPIAVENELGRNLERANQDILTNDFVGGAIDILTGGMSLPEAEEHRDLVVERAKRVPGSLVDLIQFAGNTLSQDLKKAERFIKDPIGTLTSEPIPEKTIEPGEALEGFSNIIEFIFNPFIKSARAIGGFVFPEDEGTLKTRLTQAVKDVVKDPGIGFISERIGEDVFTGEEETLERIAKIGGVATVGTIAEILTFNPRGIFNRIKKFPTDQKLARMNEILDAVEKDVPKLREVLRRWRPDVPEFIVEGMSAKDFINSAQYNPFFGNYLKAVENRVAPRFTLKTERGQAGFKKKSPIELKENPPKTATPEEIVQRAFDIFGKTTVPESAGFITKSGEFIDSSGQTLGATGEGRNIDHREIASDSLPESSESKTGSESLVEFQNITDSIRLNVSPEDVFVDLVNRPTDEQFESILELSEDREAIVVDITNKNGDVVGSGEFKTFEEFKNFVNEKLPPEKPSKARTPIGKKNVQEILKEKHKDLDFFVGESEKEFTLSKIVVPKGERGEGKGTQFMNDLIKHADNVGKRIVLTPTKDFGGGITRLKEFYKRFGFVENKGKVRDFTTKESFIREPKDVSRETLPEFKNTEEAIAFGKTATKEQVLALKEVQKSQNKITDKLQAIKDPTDAELQQGMTEATKGQLIREAIQSSEGKIKDISKEVKDGKTPITKEEKLFGAQETEEVKLLTFDKLIKGEGFTMMPSSEKMTEFIRNLPENINRREAIKQFEKTFKELSRETPKGVFKKAIQEEAGIKKSTEKIQRTEQQLLKERLRQQSRGATIGFKVGAREAKDELFLKVKEAKTSLAEKKNAFINYANEQLSGKDKGKLLAQVKNITTVKGLSRGIAMVDRLSEKAGRNEALSNLKNTIRKTDIKKLRPEFQIEINNILDIDLKKVSERKRLSLESTLRFIEGHPDNNIPESKLNELNRLSTKNVSDLTTEEITLVNQAVQHMIKLNQLKNKLKFGKKLVEFKEIRNDAVKNVNRKTSLKRNPNFIDTTEKPIEANKVQEIFSTESYNMELISEILDKEGDGIIKKIMYGGIDKGYTKMLDVRQKAEDFINEKIEGIDVLNWSEKYHTTPTEKNVDYQHIDLPSGKKLKITKAERISFELHSRNEKNLRHLLEGGFSFEKTKFTINKLTSEDLQKILSTVTDEEMTVSNAIYEYFNVNQKKLLNEASVELNGWEVATESDYFPIRTNALDIKRDQLKLQKNFARSTLEGLGILKERTNANNAIILEDALSTFYRSVKQSSAYIGMAEPLRNAKALSLDKTFRQTIAHVYGEHYVRSLDNYLRDMESQSFDTRLVDKLTLDVINKMQVAVLGINPFVIAKQPISFILASSEMDIIYLSKAKTPASKDIIRKHSPQLRDRVDGNVNREVGEIGQAGESLKFWTDQNILGQKFMKGIQEFDYQAIGRIWKAVELETQVLFPNLEVGSDAYYKKVADRSEEVIRKTQPTFAQKDRSAIGRNKRPFIRLLTTFMSQRNKNLMIGRRAIEKYNVSEKTDADKKKLAKTLTGLLIVAPALLMAVDKTRDFLYGRDPPKKPFESNVLQFIELNLGNVYFVGNVFRSIRSKIERGTFTGYDVNDLFSSTVDESVNGVVELYNAIDQSISEERYISGKHAGELKWKQSAKRALNKVISVASKVKGIPYQPVKKLLEIPFKIEERFDKKVGVGQGERRKRRKRTKREPRQRRERRKRTRKFNF